VTRVYIESSLLVLEGPGPEGRMSRPDASRPAPGALDAITNLGDAGHDVVVLLSGAGRSPGRPQSLPPGLADLPSETDGPGVPSSGGWLVTTDLRRCEHRPPGVRSILVGPRRPPGPRPTAHCDLEARDLGAAVLEILAREAMA